MTSSPMKQFITSDGIISSAHPTDSATSTTFYCQPKMTVSLHPPKLSNSIAELNNLMTNNPVSNSQDCISQQGPNNPMSDSQLNNGISNSHNQQKADIASLITEQLYVPPERINVPSEKLNFPPERINVPSEQLNRLFSTSLNNTTKIMVPLESVVVDAGSSYMNDALSSNLTGQVNSIPISLITQSMASVAQVIQSDGATLNLVKSVPLSVCSSLSAAIATQSAQILTSPTNQNCLMTPSNGAQLIFDSVPQGCQIIIADQGVITDQTEACCICQWEKCEQIFSSMEDLVNHVNDFHVRLEKPNMEYLCKWDQCPRKGKSFNARYKMLIHIRTHTNEKPHRCPVCGKSFSRLENLKIHNRSHTGEKPYVCPFEGCNKAYSNSSDRFKHVRTHQEDKPFVCRTASCNKRYTDPSSLRKHIRTHGHYFPRRSGNSNSAPSKVNFTQRSKPDIKKTSELIDTSAYSIAQSSQDMTNNGLQVEAHKLISSAGCFSQDDPISTENVKRLVNISPTNSKSALIVSHDIPLDLTTNSPPKDSFSQAANRTPSVLQL